MPSLSLTRGARRLRFFRGRPALVVLRGELQHKNLWLIDLETGAERQLTDLPADFTVRGFDVSADGREVVFERVQEHSDVVVIDLRRWITCYVLRAECARASRATCYVRDVRSFRL